MRKRHKRVLARRRNALIKLHTTAVATGEALERLAQSIAKVRTLWIEDGRD